MEKNIFFVRHAESEANTDGIHRGPHSLLTGKGENQAAIVAGRAAKLNVDTLISTTYPRARSTAERISARIGLPIEESDLFVERRRPSFVMGRSVDDPEVKQATVEIFDGYLQEGHRHSDEENLDDLRKRGNACLAFLASHPGIRLCVVTHGFFLRVLFCSAVYGPDFTGAHFQGALRSLETSNTGLFHFQYRPDPWADEPGTHRWYVSSWNDAAHLG